MPNSFVHVELNSTDLEKSKSFYTRLFQWKLEQIPGANNLDYTLIKTGEGVGGGMMAQQCPGAPSAWMPYVYVDDVKAYTEKAKALGATMLLEVMEVPDVGWLSVMQDPTGATIGIYQPK